MKKIILGMAVAAVGFSACNKSLLNTEPSDRYVESNFWTSPEAANAALTGCYAVLRNSGIYGGGATALWEETASPNAYNYSNSMGFNAIAEGLQSAASGGITQSRWKACYIGIGRCNTLLARVDEVNISDATKKVMKAEARFLRAYYYYMLATYYGDAPLILDPPDLATQADLPRTPRAEVVQQVLTDLDAAAADLPLKVSSSNKGHATQGAALALKARVLLYEASPLLNTGNDLNKWKAAADAAKAVIDMASSAGYGLFSDYRGLFLPQNENNKEVIFDIQFMYPDQGNSFDLIGKQYNTNAPLLGLAEAYDMDNGLPITDPASGYDPNDPYANRDPRLYATIVYPGATFMNEVVTDTRFAITGYGMKKYTIYDQGPPPAGKSDLKSGQSETNFIVLRYADILLMYAEAQNEFAGQDQSVLDAINEVRERVGMPDITGTYSKDELRAIIHHERRVEFAGEALYYNDIRRWKTAEQELNAPIKKYDGSVLETRSFNANRDYWWPLPQDELDLNPSLEQNPNY